MMDHVHVLNHPLIQHKLSILRSKNTSVKEFRELVSEISALMCYEATRNLPMEAAEVETPIGMAKVQVLAGKKLAIVPVLRAGLGMVDAMIDLIPSAKIGHIGLFRDPETHEPVKYYCKMPNDIAERQVFIVDPMLATGGSAVAAITFVKEYGCKSITLMNIIAAPEGIKAVREAHPDVDIFVAAVDEKLERPRLHRPRSGGCRRPDLWYQISRALSNARCSASLATACVSFHNKTGSAGVARSLPDTPTVGSVWITEIQTNWDGAN